MKPWWMKYYYMDEATGDTAVVATGGTGGEKTGEQPITETKTGEQPTTETKTGDAALERKPTLLGNGHTEAKPDEKTGEAPVADQRKFLTDAAKTDADKKALEGKTDEEIGKLYKAAQNQAVKDQITDPKDYKITLPEGFSMNKPAFEKFAMIAARAKASNAEVQAVIDEYAKGAEEAAKAPYLLWQKTQAEWRGQVEKDPEIGGTKLEANLALSAKFLDSLPNAAAVREALDFTGAGNHPEIIKAFIAAGKAMSEGTPVAGGPGNKGALAKSAAEVFYPTQGEK